jgi:hypothetical protein
VDRKIQLVILFSIAGVVVFITILRLPLILNQAVSQRSRSMVSLAPRDSETIC